MFTEKIPPGKNINFLIYVLPGLTCVFMAFSLCFIVYLSVSEDDEAHEQQRFLKHEYRNTLKDLSRALAKKDFSVDECLKLTLTLKRFSKNLPESSDKKRLLFDFFKFRRPKNTRNTLQVRTQILAEIETELKKSKSTLEQKNLSTLIVKLKNKLVDLRPKFLRADRKKRTQFMKARRDFLRNMLLLFITLSLVVSIFSLVFIRKYEKERMLSLQNAKNHRDSLKAIINSIPSVVVVTDKNTKIQYLNKTAMELVDGKNRDEFLNKSKNETFPFFTFCKDESEEEHKEKCHTEEGYIKKNEENIPVIRDIRPFHIQGQDFFIVSFFDLRPLKEAEKMKAQAKKYIQGLGEAISIQFKDWGFTRAEKEVGLLLLKGFSFKEIAKLRGTSEKTVRQQALIMYRKSGTEGRADFSAFFLEDLLLPLEEREEYPQPYLLPGS
ncbi:PAS domain-containing protein [Candidatus Riflebacteria bacterium]